MMREHTDNNLDIWKRLAEPVGTDAIAWRQDGRPIARDGRFFARYVAYIEATTVRERLDAVVPGEWNLTLDPLDSRTVADDDGVDGGYQYAFKARLQILGVVREDVGIGKDWKQASTDAFKRVAVRFGIGHELYSFEQNWVPMDGDGKYAKPLEDPGAVYARRQMKVEGTDKDALAKQEIANTREPFARGLIATDIPPCPKCGAKMWDNRIGKRNSRAPDFKCRDRSCDGVIWPPRPTAQEQEAPPTRPGDEPPHPASGAYTDQVPF